MKSINVKNLKVVCCHQVVGRRTPCWGQTRSPASTSELSTTCSVPSRRPVTTCCTASPCPIWRYVFSFYVTNLYCRHMLTESSELVQRQRHIFLIALRRGFEMLQPLSWLLTQRFLLICSRVNRRHLSLLLSTLQLGSALISPHW